MENQGTVSPSPYQTSSPESRTPPPKFTPNNRRFSLAKAPLLAFYVVVLIIGMVSVYALQNGQLQSTKQALAAAQNTAQNLSENQAHEANTIDSDKYQAVFLTSGQVYFGKLTFVDQHYFKLTGIYYLQSGGSQGLQLSGQQGLQATTSSAASSASKAASTDVSLIKLGCELHQPYDQMTINRDRVDFWENIQDNGQVAKAIQTFTKTNPTGQKCSAV